MVQRRRRKTPTRRATAGVCDGSGGKMAVPITGKGEGVRDVAVLVTGGSGMLGTHIVEELCNGAISRQLGVSRIVVFDKKPFERLGDLPFEEKRTADKLGAGIEYIQGDITNKEEVRNAMLGCTIVLHACSVVDFGNIPSSVVWKVNVEGTRNVVECAHAVSSVQGLIYTSSLDVVFPDNLPGLLGAEETAPYAGKAGHSVYVKSKIEAEKMCLKTCKSGSLPLCVLRPPGIYGERSLYHITAELAAARDAGAANWFKIGLGDAIFQRCYAGNVAHLHICAMKTLLEAPKRCHGKVYFATDDTPVCNFFHFSEPYLKAKGYKVATIPLPYHFMYYVAWLVEACNHALLRCGLGTRTLLLTREAVQGTCLSFSATGKAARKDLDYTPRYTKQEAFEQTLSYYKENPEFPKGSFVYSESQCSSPSEARVPAINGREFAFVHFCKVCLAVYVYVFVLMRYKIVVETHWEEVVGPESSATVTDVYRTLVDFESYPDWNTFTTNVKTPSPLTVGNAALLGVNLRQPGTSQYSTMNLNFEILEVVENERVCWAYQMVPKPFQKYILGTRRCFELQEKDNSVYLRHFDINYGPISPLIKVFFNDPIQEGFQQMTNDLRTRLLSQS